MKIYERHNTIIGMVIGGNDYGCRVRDDGGDKVVFY